MTKPNKKAVATEATAPVANQAAPQQISQEDLTPARCAVILIEAVDRAQQVGGVYTLEDAALLAACKKILLGAITPAAAEAPAPVQQEA